MKKNPYSINLAIYNRFQEEMSLGLNDVKKVLTELKKDDFLEFSEIENKIKITFGKGKYSKRDYFLAIERNNELTNDLREWNKDTSRIYLEITKQSRPVEEKGLIWTHLDFQTLTSKIEDLTEKYCQMLEDPSPDDF